MTLGAGPPKGSGLPKAGSRLGWAWGSGSGEVRVDMACSVRFSCGCLACVTRDDWTAAPLRGVRLGARCYPGASGRVLG